MTIFTLAGCTTASTNRTETLTLCELTVQNLADESHEVTVEVQTPTGTVLSETETVGGADDDVSSWTLNDRLPVEGTELTLVVRLDDGARTSLALSERASDEVATFVEINPNSRPVVFYSHNCVE